MCLIRVLEIVKLKSRVPIQLPFIIGKQIKCMFLFIHIFSTCITTI